MLEAGTKAPEIVLKDKDGNEVRLSNYLGKKVVVYFYPRDNTPGCSRQAQAFARTHEEYINSGAVVIGISKDSEASHQRFADKYDLPFILLSDPDLTVIRAYDVWKEKMNYGKPTMGVVRTTYLIENGVIVKAFGKVKAADNPKQMLEELAFSS